MRIPCPASDTSHPIGRTGPVEPDSSRTTHADFFRHRGGLATVTAVPLCRGAGVADSDKSKGKDGKKSGITGSGVVLAGVALAILANGVGEDGGTGDTPSEEPTNGVAQSKQAAQSGRADEAWRALNLRTVQRRNADPAVDCVSNSYGQVRDFFLRTPCRALDRALFTLADPAGNTVVVSVSWVRMHDPDAVGRLKSLIDTNGTGSVTQLDVATLRAQGVRFTGTPFQSRPQQDLLVVAEGAVVTGQPDPELFATVVDVAVELPG
jgi:hypothetical protein